jgi:hypothetical protein
METFVVRIFVPAVHGEALPLCGIVEHVASGHAESFQGVEDLVRTVAGALERRGGAERAAADDRGGS